MSKLVPLVLALALAHPHGLDRSDRDPAVRAADDLYLSQNGGWIERTTLGPSQPNAAYWRDLRVLSAQRLQALVAEAAAKKTTDPVEEKAGAFYRSFIDEKRIEAKGIEPLQPELDAIRAVHSKSELAALMGRVAGPGTVRAATVRTPLGRALFSLDVAQDPNDPAHYALFIGQAGLQMPGAEYYNDPKLADLKAAYHDYVARMLTLIGWPDAQTRAAQIVAFEGRVAGASWTREQMGDVMQTYNPMTLEDLIRFAPGFDWRAFLGGAELPATGRVVIDAKSAFPAIAKIYDETPLDVLQARQAFAAADAAAPLLDHALADASFDFRAKRFAGLFQVPLARTLGGEQVVETNMPDALSAMYVARYFSAEAKAKALEMARNLVAALDVRLASLTWMSPPTRMKARQKLAAMELHIGYPEHFLQYDGLTIRDDDLYGNVARAAAWNWRHSVAKLGQPVDRAEWALAPAYPQYAYAATRNSVEISAATLQPPFFDPQADDAVNYGAIGAVIGQQLVAGFDHHGGRYDATGRLADWWTADERKHFDEETAKIVAQYSAVEALPGLHANGELLADEALDDVGGLLIALDAYHLSLHGRLVDSGQLAVGSGPSIQPTANSQRPTEDDLTPDQRFFLGRAQMWRAKFSETFTRNQIATGLNAPPFLRVNGPARNIDAFYDAFDVRPEDRMYLPPEKRMRAWGSALLMPRPEDFQHPFVEPVHVIREWDGEADGDQFGWIARNLGDVDGDGVPDFVTSAPTWHGGAGKVYVYSTRSGALAWSADGKPGDQLGTGVEAAGDTNRDGIPDVIAGAPGRGKVYVYSGKDGRVLQTFTVESQHVSGAGDVDRDGYADVIVGAPTANKTYVYSGKDGHVILTLAGETAGDQFGATVAGYAKGDRMFLVVGAPGVQKKGRTYVYTSLTEKPAFVIDADETGAALGRMFVSVVGDVDGDGVPDVYASDWANAAKGRGTGRVYVHSGADGKRLLTLTGETAGEGFGIGPATAGDVDADGHDDLIVGSWQYGGAAKSGGRAYLYSGNDGSLMQTYTCRVPGDTFGFDAVGMGDVDGDGASDFLITSGWSDIHGYQSGRVLIISSRVSH